MWREMKPVPARLRRAVLPGWGCWAAGIWARINSAARVTATLPQASKSAGSTAINLALVLSSGSMDRPFDSLYSHGFARVAAAVPHLRPAEPRFNVERTLALAGQASEANAALAVFPELGLSAYAIDDLFHQQALTDGVLDGLAEIVEASNDLLPVLIVGGPLWVEGGVFNCAIVIHRGRVLGVVPK